LGTGFVLGAIRVPPLVPRVGERTAELLETPLMLVVVALQDRSIAEYAASRDPAAGGVYLAALVFVATMPTVLLRFEP
jgi:hypothetical protein